MPPKSHESGMSLKRGAKGLAVGAATSNQALAPAFLWALRTGFGPVKPGNPTAAVACFSVDFDVTHPSRFDDNRRGTLALTELSGRYGIPLTWAVCGMSAEADMRSYSAIADSIAGTEVGVHTYSHLDATTATSDEFRADIERCIQALGLSAPRTFVFPWNREAHFDVVRALGFRAYRGKDRAVGAPVSNQGVWNVRPVYYVDQKSRGAESLIRKYIDLCVCYSFTFHLLTHPRALAIDGDAAPMMKTMESVFAYVAEMKNRSLLGTSTLGEIAARLDAPGDPGVQRLPSMVRAS